MLYTTHYSVTGNKNKKRVFLKSAVRNISRNTMACSEFSDVICGIETAVLEPIRISLVHKAQSVLCVEM
jgi:hypothetical protein